MLGCGYTGRRLARTLLQAGTPVLATARRPEALAELAGLGARVRRLDLDAPETVRALVAAAPHGARALWSIPPAAGQERLLEALGPRLARLALLSSTSVYGARADVDAATPAEPDDEVGRARLRAEELARASCASTLVLRPAAIYGPWRGVHARLRAGALELRPAQRLPSSRVHVDDLVAHCAAALESALDGAWPVADEDPAPTAEVARWCAARLGLAPPPEVAGEPAHRGRRVDGSAVRARLGIALRQRTFREGLVASLAEEAAHPGRAP